MKSRERVAWMTLLFALSGWYLTAFKLVCARSRLAVYEDGLRLKAYYGMLAEDLRDAARNK